MSRPCLTKIRTGRPARAVAVALVVALCGSGTVAGQAPSPAGGGQSPAPGPVFDAADPDALPIEALPPGATPLPPEAVRQWDLDLYTTYAALAGRITGEKDAQGRLLGINGAVIPLTTLIGLLLVRDAIVRALRVTYRGFVTILSQPAEEQARLSRQFERQAGELRKAFAEYKAAEAAFKSFLADEDRYRNQMAEADRLESSGRLEDAAALRLEATEHNYYSAFVRARDRYAALLAENPVLAIKNSDGVFLYDSYADTPVSGGDGGYARRLRAFVVDGMVQTQAEATRLETTWELEELAPLASPVYGAVHNNLAMTGTQVGSPLLIDIVNELNGARDSSLKDWTDDAWDRTLQNPVVILATVVGSVFVPVIGLGLTFVQVYQAGDNLVVAYQAEETASDQAQAIGWTPLLEAEVNTRAAAKEFFVTLPFAVVDVGMAIRARKIVRLQREQRAAFKEIQTAYQARQPARRVAAGAADVEVTPVASADDVLNRIDTEWLEGIPRFGTPGDGSFFAANGLAPRITVDVNGQRFHLSAPFRGPEEKVIVIAFQEAPNGKVIPRTFYTSGEHGLWRVATGRGQRLHKGPTKALDPFGNEIPQGVDPKSVRGARTKFINESVSDIDASLQGPLSRWVGERGVIEDLPGAVRTRAFEGHLEAFDDVEAAQEFMGQYAGRSAIERPLDLTAPGSRPDLQSAPLDRWTMRHAEYGDVTGEIRRSEDGALLFIVMRDSQGHVWVPSVQDARAATTSFGTRDAAFLTDLTTTPISHKGAIEIPGSKYSFDPNYRNELNRLFEDVNPATGGPSPAGSPFTNAFGGSGVPGVNPRPAAGAGDSGASTLVGGGGGPVDSRAATVLDRPGGRPLLGSGTVGPGGVRGGDTLGGPGAARGGAEPNSLFDTQVLHPTELPARAVPAGGEFHLLSDIGNPFYTAARALADEKNFLSGLVVRSRANRGLTDADAILFQQLAGTSRQSQEAYLAGLKYRGFIVDHQYTGIGSYERHLTPILEGPEFDDLNRFVRAYDDGARVTRPDPIPSPSRVVIGDRSIETWDSNAVRPPGTVPPPPPPAPAGRSWIVDALSRPMSSQPTAPYVPVMVLSDDGDTARSQITQQIAANKTRLEELWGTLNGAGSADLTYEEREMASAEYRTLMNAQTMLVRQRNMVEAFYGSGRRTTSAGTPVDPAVAHSTGAAVTVPSPVASQQQANQWEPKRRGSTFTFQSTSNAAFLNSASPQSATQSVLGWLEQPVRVPGTTTGARLDLRQAPIVPWQAPIALLRWGFRGPLDARTSTFRGTPDGAAGWMSTSLSFPPSGHASPASGPTSIGHLSAPGAFQQAAGGASEPGVKVFLTSLGEMTGEAFKMVVVNEGGAALDIDSGSMILEPVARVSQQQIDREIQRLKGLPQVSTTIDGYCLDMRKLPPAVGMVFRIAPQALQQRYAAARAIPGAARVLLDAGKLTGGTGASYLHQVRQWSVWALQEQFDQGGFERAFIEHSKQNIAAARRPWTRELEGALRQLLPARWADVRQVLAAAKE